MSDKPALCVRDLRVELVGTQVDIVDDISFNLDRGHVLGLVGESGCGKTSVAMALLNHCRPGTRIARGEVVLGGTDILKLPRRMARQVRGRRISYVPQDPSRSLNPRKRIGDQIEEVLRVHGRPRAAYGRIPTLLDAVHLPTARDFLRRFPHQLSGGQQQRVVLTMALVCDPEVVVLDEPTTGLDVTTQARVLEAITSLRELGDSAFVYVTHDLAVLTSLADRIGVMYAGRLVELGAASTILSAPTHPYTARLISSTPSIHDPASRQGITGTAPVPGTRPRGCFFAPRCPLAKRRCHQDLPLEELIFDGHMVRCWHWRASSTLHVISEAPASVRQASGRSVLQVEDLNASYGRGDSKRTVLHDISLTIRDGECVGVVGESGSGKSTLVRCIGGLHHGDQGVVRLDGTRLDPDVRHRSQAERRAIQLVYQNPDRSLNPRRTVADQVGRPLQLFDLAAGIQLRGHVEQLLERVRLPRSFAHRFPNELSGGEKQRVAIARALAARPRVLLCDEVTSALDVSVQAAVLGLIDELRREEELAVLLISHDLGVVNWVTDRTLVLQDGRVREEGMTRELLRMPADEYTRALIAASPELPTNR